MSPILTGLNSLILAGAVGVGIAARIWDLGRRSFWFDELYCVVGAATSTSITQLKQAWMDVDGHPPGFMLALYAWFKLVPATEFTGRLPGCVVSILAIVGLLCAARGPRPSLPMGVAFYAAALYALGSEPIYYAQTVRQYGLLIACGLGALLDWLQIYEDPSANRKLWIRLVGWLLLASYLHYLALLFVAAILAVAFLRALAVRRSVTTVLLAGCAFALAYLPGFWALKRTVDARNAGWQPPETLRAVASDLLIRGFFGPAWRIGVVAMIAVIVLAFMRRSASNRSLRLSTSSSFHAVALVLLLMLLAFAVLSRLAPFFLQLRYALVLYAPLLLVIAWIMAELAPVDSVRGTVLLSGILVMGIVSYGEYRKTTKQDWRASAEHVIAQHAPGDRIFVLAADPAVSPDVYLRNGQADGYFNCRMVPFYAFYFERLGAPQLAAELRFLPLQSKKLISVLRRSRTHTSFVLAPHHTRIKGDAQKRLKDAGFEVEDTAMFSTHLYKIRARN